MAAEVQRYDVENDATLAYDSWVTIGLEDNYMNSRRRFHRRLRFSMHSKKGDVDHGQWCVVCFAG